MPDEPSPNPPVDVAAHLNSDVKPDLPPPDTRGADLHAARTAAAAGVAEAQAPRDAIFLTEIQEMHAELRRIRLVTTALNYLGGVAFALAIYYYARKVSE